jgi:hypothetical protein
VSGDGELEHRYRRWLRWYPGWFRREHGEELLAVLLAGAETGRQRADPRECLALVAGAARLRLYPRVPRSAQDTLAVIRLMYLGALVELLVTLSILTTLDDVRAGILARDPAYTQAQWIAEVRGTLWPLAAAGGLAVGFWLWMAWAHGRGHRWVTALFAVFFAENTYSLLNGVAGGSAIYARTDLVAAILLWFVEAATFTVLLRGWVRSGAAPGPSWPVRAQGGRR